jgi:RNA-directed DNA polymerase
MVAQQLHFDFEFNGGRFSCSSGEAQESGSSVRQVTAASKTAEPAVRVTMEEVVGRQNLQRALKRVCANQGSPGVDGMTVDQLRDHLRVHWPEIRQQLLDGQYTPQPVKQVLIPKPDGSSRTLGIPTVVDRFIQQALLQALSPMYDPGFSANSFGFRPGRSAHQAVRQAKQYIAQGYEWVVDIDLEKCFDRINHDILMGRLSRRISDKRILRLTRGYLQAGVMVNGVVQERYEGTPQGGPLSPLLSNILLDELDQELERRGHKFCRYADDCNIYVRSERSGKRVMETIEGFLWKRLKLKVNRQKSAVARPQERQFLGFSFTSNRWLKIKLADKALKKAKHRIKKITRRSRGVSLLQVVKELNTYLRGWLGYFRLIETPTIIRDLDSWIRRRLRCYVMKQWIKNSHTRYQRLRSLGVSAQGAGGIAASRKGPWALSNAKPLKVALSNRFFVEKGLFFLLDHYELSVTTT